MKKNFTLGDKGIIILQGDITKANVDAIVNAANSQLAGGGGVDGAIHRAAGPELKKAGMKWVQENGPLPTGEAVITPGFKLKAKYVIHTVGPIYRDGKHNEPELLKNAYKNSLKLADSNHLTTIAFPAISCGVYGYPKREAAQIAIGTIKEVLPNTGVKTCYLYLFSEDMFKLWCEVAEEIFNS
ncbi:O-acetyl-ADP-ribose deacetylase [Desulfothermus okinawensis JCM 13304]